MNVSQLRFKEFDGEWSKRKLTSFLEKISKPVTVNPEQYYVEIGIRSHGKGIFHKEPILGKALGDKRVFWIVEDALVLNIVFAWEHAVAKTTMNDKGLIASHRFPMYLPRKNQASINFITFLFLTKKGKNYLELASPGGAGRNKTLGQKNFEELVINIPTLPEQIKIANFLTAIDERINQLTRKKELMTQYKQGVMQQIFSQQLRFKDDNGEDFADWEDVTLDDILAYEQPQKYLVSSTDYDNSFNIPVLTAGKTFILGYTDEDFGIFEKGLPVIIFDDFTTAFKFVDFPFKAKSSAMKILKVKNNKDSIKYIFEAMNMIEFTKGDEHKRYWISEYSKITIPLPSKAEQTKIANFLTVLDEKIQQISQQIEATKQYKQGLLQQMFV